MTKKEYLAISKKVFDKHGQQLKPGDTVVFADNYTREVHLGILDHFAERTVIVYFKYKNWKYKIKRQVYPDRLIKIKDAEGNFSESLNIKF